MGDGFDYEAEKPTPYVFLQWKGTDACLDFHCSCSHQMHFDGDFAYVLECPHCHAAWEMPYYLYPREASPEKRQDAKVMERNDED